MFGGQPTFMPPMYAPPQGYAPAPQAYTQYAPPRRPAVPAAPAPVYRGAMGSESSRPAVPARRAPLKIPTPEELGVAPARVAQRAPLKIPTPEELGVSPGQYAARKR